ncbi:phosphotransferase family protein [Paenibacillus sp. GCM10023248]|uniref:phosphotransferase family protein n=1 Tax=Bacillales TaxID=1385 RepID=UPI002379BC81|nr:MULTISPECIES: aminoglycoside phosphotransferase family protein [Bacillales]MDD9266404.1 aminoglycoside phosphotransferase family protein [Paenibacillus sp. MAHUQ-63]MDR6878529.1 hygromycin-B 4-O-kinase [Bacillus sp. 3255]
MAPIKPIMDTATAQALLERILKSPVTDVQPIDQGEVSKVFSFRQQQQSFIVHFNSGSDGFVRERYIHATFSPQGVPAPRVREIGRANEDLCYAIADKVPGRTIISYPIEDIRRILPDVVEQFALINRLQLGGTKGYGWIQPSGDGSHDTWTDFLASFFLEKQTGFWEGWFALFETTFLEKKVFDRLYGVMMELAKHSPEQRYVVHGDFHLGNMLSDGNKVTGIVDWEMAFYGDFVFDLASQHLWTPQLQIPDMVRSAWADRGQEIPHFEDRLKCALLFKGIDGLRFYAKKDDRNAYESVKAELLRLVK